MKPEEVDALLRAEVLAHLACASLDGKPYVVPVAYAFDGEALYVHSLPGMKLDVLRKNPRVCVEIERLEGPQRWRTVVAHGEFQELRGAEATVALRRLVERLLPPGAAPAGVDPFAPPEMAAQAVLFRVRLTERSGLVAAP